MWRKRTETDGDAAAEEGEDVARDAEEYFVFDEASSEWWWSATIQ